VLELWTDNSAGEDIILYEASSGIDEAQFVVDEIKEKIGTDITSQSGRKLADFAVLYRTNAQSRVFEEALIKSGIPYQIIGGVRFYERREIKDILAYLRLVINPQDTVSYERIVNVPPRGIGPVKLKQGGPSLTKFHEMMEEFKTQAKELNVLELMDLVLEKIDNENYIHDGTEEGISRWENVRELRSVAESFAEMGPIESLNAFLESVALLEQSDIVQDSNAKLSIRPNTDQADRVTLMTLHAAKGLEFPVVFIVGMEEGIFPHSRSLDDRFELEEERRLCYVGITRAMEKLYLTYARTRTYFGSFNANVPSRFLKELPQHIVQFKQAENDAGGWAGDYRRRSDAFEPDPLNPWEI